MRLAIIHFQPVETYPPAINLIDYCSTRKDIGSISLFTGYNAWQLPDTSFSNCKVYRPVRHARGDFRATRMLKALWFNFFVTIKLFALRPSTIIYYETSSALPVYIYMLFFSKRTQLYIHYHEYTSPLQYKQGMVLDKWWHKLEQKFLYKKAKWISQTNEYRISFFLRDNPSVDKSKMQVLPNYPPRSWVNYARGDKFSNRPIRVVQVGSISTQHMYATEFIKWISSQNGLFHFDIYSLNAQPDVLQLLKDLDCPWVSFKGGVSYNQVPAVLKDYDIGVILYKANSENVVYCASNKLFEYLAVGLDVWVTKAMLGSKPYYRNDVYPKILEVDFERLQDFDYRSAINREGIPNSPSPYYMEEIYSGLINNMAS
jgi:hypothetical protein